MDNDSGRIVAALDDLLFSVKISDAARRAGLSVKFVKSQAALFEEAGLKPALIILDLNCAAVQPFESLSRLKSDAQRKQIPVLGYVSHVQVDVRQQAQDLGCDVVLPRSAFSQNLPSLLQEYAGK